MNEIITKIIFETLEKHDTALRLLDVSSRKSQERKTTIWLISLLNTNSLKP